jgi:drug/metabolite transporter (DMT)-like permease
MTNNRVYIGILFALFAVFLLCCLDVIAKILLIKYSVMQLTFLRSGFALLIVGISNYLSNGMGCFRTGIKRWHLLRTLLMIIATTTFFVALGIIPLVNVIVIVFIAPILMTALSGPILGEHVGPWRWLAVIIGFIGMLIILKPTAALNSQGTIYALIGVIAYALISLTSRKLSSQDSAYNLTFYMFFGPTIIGGLGSLNTWLAPTPLDWLYFVLTGITGGAAFIFYNLAFQRAEASLLASFEYTGLIWATLAGYLIFNESVEFSVWIGAIIIISGGLIIIHRESNTLRSIKDYIP